MHDDQVQEDLWLSAAWVNILHKPLHFFFWKGEKLQFVFRNINTSHPDNAYVVTMGITEDGSYQSKSHIVGVKEIK